MAGGTGKKGSERKLQAATLCFLALERLVASAQARAALDHLSVIVWGNLNALELGQSREAGAVGVAAQLWELATNIVDAVAYLVVIVEAADRHPRLELGNARGLQSRQRPLIRCNPPSQGVWVATIASASPVTVPELEAECVCLTRPACQSRGQRTLCDVCEVLCVLPCQSQVGVVC